MNVREATEQDAPAIRLLVQRAYRGDASLGGWTSEGHLLADERIDLDGVLQKIRQGTVLLGFQDGDCDPVACCELRALGDGRAYFGLFAVDPARQAGGLGRQMLAEAERRARNDLDAVVLEMSVIAQRGDLIAWYERRGYQGTGRTEPFPYDALVNGSALRDDLYFVVLSKRLTG